jgi:hypothetical protein
MKKFWYIVLFFFTATPMIPHARQFNFHIEKDHDISIFTISTAEYSSSAVIIRTFQKWVNDTLFVDIRGFFTSDQRFLGSDCAETQIELPASLTENFIVQIRSEGRADLWKVSFTDGGYSALPIHKSFTSWL